MKKEIIEQGIAIIILVLVILFLVILVFKFNQMYNNYEIQGESFTIECDEIKMNVNNNNYVCTNEDYTYNFATINVLDLTKEYNIEIYYEQTSYFHWLAWWSNPKERQFRKIVVRSDDMERNKIDKYVMDILKEIMNNPYYEFETKIQYNREIMFITLEKNKLVELITNAISELKE